MEHNITGDTTSELKIEIIRTVSQAELKLFLEKQLKDR